MGAKESAEMRAALELVEQGVPAHRAAKQTGIKPNTLYAHKCYRKILAERDPALIPATKADLAVALMRQEGISARRAAETVGTSYTGFLISRQYHEWRVDNGHDVGARSREKTLAAMTLVRAGTTPKVAAEQVGMASSTLYRSPIYRKWKDERK